MITQNWLEKLVDWRWLYNEEATNERKLSDNPDGDPDIDKLIAGETEAFYEPGAKRDVKKTIIWHDIFSSVWGSEKLTDIGICVHSLINEGFEVYTINKFGELIKLTPEFNLPNLDKAPHYTTEEVIAKANRDLKKTKSDIRILNNFNIDKMLGVVHSDYQDSNVVRLTDFNKLVAKGNNPGKLKEYLNAIHPNFQWRIGVDKESIRTWHELNEVTDTNEIPTLFDPFIISHRYLDFTKECDNFSLSAESKHQEDIHIKFSEYKNGLMAKVFKICNQHKFDFSEICFDNCNLKEFDWFLRQVKHCKVLTIHNCTNLYNLTFLRTEPEASTLKQIRIFEINNCTIDENDENSSMQVWEFLKNCCRYCETMKFMELIGLKFRVKLPILENVRELDLTDAHIDSETLKILLEACPNLEVLKLSGPLINFEGLNLSKSVTFPKLRRLDVSDSNINWVQLNDLLQRMPSLEDLNIDKCEITNENSHDVSDIVLPELKSISALSGIRQPIGVTGTLLKRGKYDIDLLSRIIERSENLEKIWCGDGAINSLSHFSVLFTKLKEMRIFHFEPTYPNKVEWRDFTGIKKIILEHVTKTNTLNSVLTNDVEELDLVISDYIDPPSNNAPNAKKLSLNLTKFFLFGVVKSILNVMPNLTELHFKHDDSTIHYGINLQLNNNALKKVKKLIFEDVQSFENAKGHYIFNEVLQNTPHITDLDLKIHASRDIYNARTPPNSFFNELTSLKLRQGFGTGYFLADLLVKSPNLRKLVLERTYLDRAIPSNEEEWNFPDGYQLESLEYLEITNTDLSPSCLKKLFQIAPNLKILKIINCTNKINHIQIPDSFKSLKLLEIDNIDLSPAQLNRFQELNVPIFNYTERLLKAKNRYSEDNERPKAKIRIKPQNNNANPSSKINIDVNTKKDEMVKGVPASTIFRDKFNQKPDPSEYRIDVRNNIKANNNTFDSSQNIFELENIGDEEVSFEETKNIKYSNKSLDKTFEKQEYKINGPHLYQAKMIRQLGAAQKLPSLSAHEKITHFSVVGLDRSYYQLSYGKRDNQYSIKLLKPLPSKNNNFQVEYLLEVPRHKAKLQSEKLQKIVKEYFSADEELPEDFESGTVDEWLEILRAYRAGACRHKTVAFFSEIKKAFPDCHVRMIFNDIHAFVELKEKNSSQWVRCQLGGYLSQPKIDNGLFTENIKVDPKFMAASSIDEDPQFTFNTRANPARETNRAQNQSRHQSKKKTRVINPAFEEPKPLPKIDPKLFIEQEVFALNEEVKNILVDLNSAESVEALQLSIRQLAKDTHRPIFYIDSPDEMPNPKSWLTREDKVAELHKGFGGPFVDFLKAHENANPNETGPPILLVNWQNFKEDDIANFNSLMDPERNLFQLPIPEQFNVVGVYNSNHPEAYSHGDFYSRFHNHLQPAYTVDDLIDKNKRVLEIPEQAQPVYLHNSEDWFGLLCGRWKIDGNNLSFEKGPLFDAIDKNISLKLIDAPLKDRKFQAFMSRLQIEKSIHIAGHTYSLSDLFSVQISDEHFDIAKHAKNVLNIYTTSEPPPLQAKIINPLSFNKFILDYDIVGAGLKTKDGWLKQASDGALELYVSHELTASQWGLLTELAEKHQKENPNFKLNIIVTEKNLIHETLNDYHKGLYPTEIEKVPLFINVIETNNTDEYLGTIAKNKPDPMVIDCSDYSYTDLFDKIARGDINQLLNFEFKEGAINNALKSGRHIVLTGTFSYEMRQYLCQFAASHPEVNGKLTIVTETPLPELKNLSHYSLDIPRKPAEKINIIHIEEPVLSDQSLSAENSQIFLQNRNKILREALEQKSPITVIYGETGVGKTTSIQDFFENEEDIEICYEFENLEAYVQKPKPGKRYKVIWIDEFNLTAAKKREYTEFISLLKNIPPQMVVNGKIVELDERYRVFLGGNRKNYGGERHEPKLLDVCDHNVVTFDRLPATFLYTSILSPILNKLNLTEDQRQSISQQLLKLYLAIEAIPSENPLITARELKSMAWMFAVHYKPGMDHELLAKQCALTIASHVIHDQFWLKNWAKQNGYTNLPALIYPQPDIKNITVTKSRHAIISRICEMLAIRQLKTKDDQLVGELSAVVLEGAPGTGKSLLLKQLLTSNNIQFYECPGKLAYDQAKEIYEKAFKENAVILMDEINCSPAKERLLNEYLSKGLQILASQNPPTYGGRRQLSEALKHRRLGCNVANYNHDEMVEVLSTDPNHLIQQTLAEQIVMDYEYAIEAQPNRKPPLSFRDLTKKSKLRIATGHIAETLDQRLSSLSTQDIGDLIRTLLKDGYLSKITKEYYNDMIRDLNSQQIYVVQQLLKNKVSGLVVEEKEDDIVVDEESKDDLKFDNDEGEDVIQLEEEPLSFLDRKNRAINQAYYQAYEYSTLPLQMLAGFIDYSLSFVWNTLIIDSLLSFYVVPKWLISKESGTLTEEFANARKNKIVAAASKLINVIIKPVRFVIEEVAGFFWGMIPALVYKGWTQFSFKADKVKTAPLVRKNTVPAKNLVKENMVGKSCQLSNPMTFYRKALRSMDKSNKSLVNDNNEHLASNQRKKKPSRDS